MLVCGLPDDQCQEISPFHILRFTVDCLSASSNRVGILMVEEQRSCQIAVRRGPVGIEGYGNFEMLNRGLDVMTLDESSAEIKFGR